MPTLPLVIHHRVGIPAQVKRCAMLSMAESSAGPSRVISPGLRSSLKRKPLDDTPTQPFKKSRPKKTVKFDKKAVPAGPAGDYSLKTPGLFKIPAMERDFYDHYRKVHARAVVESN